MIDKIAVGNRILTLRKELGYSQATLAEKLNVSTQAVSKWETGLALPDIEVLLNISRICKISVNTILEGDGFIDTQNSIDRGIATVSKYIICPKCHGKLALNAPEKTANHDFLAKKAIVMTSSMELSVLAPAR